MRYYILRCIYPIIKRPTPLSGEGFAPPVAGEERTERERSKTDRPKIDQIDRVNINPPIFQKNIKKMKTLAPWPPGQDKLIESRGQSRSLYSN
jgi:hypothetical protein